MLLGNSNTTSLNYSNTVYMLSHLYHLSSNQAYILESWEHLLFGLVCQVQLYSTSILNTQTLS